MANSADDVIDLAYMQSRMNDIFMLKHKLKNSAGGQDNIEKIVDVLEFLAWKIDKNALKLPPGKNPDIDDYAKLQTAVNALAQNIQLAPNSAKICCYLAISLCHGKAGCWCSHP